MTTRDLVIEGTSSGFVNPGGFAASPRVTSTLDRSQFATRANLKAGADSLFRPAFPGGGLNVRITVQGYRTVRNHVAAVDAMIPGAIGIIHQQTGRLVVREARRSMREDFPRPPIDTGDTHDSIYALLETRPNEVTTSIGPTTFYSPLIEFGLARHFTYGPRPFMSIAFATVLPRHLRALQDLARVATVPRARISGGDYGPPVNSFLAQFRGFLYTVEKEIGDVIPVFNVPGLSGPRETLLGMARTLGDIQSVVGNAVGARFVRRLEGKVTGRLIGVGSHTIFAQKSFGARITGAERVYNRVAGKYMSKFTGQNKLFGGFGG